MSNSAPTTCCPLWTVFLNIYVCAGSANKDVDSEEFEIKKISMAEFLKSRDNCGVTLDPPIHTDFSEGYCADTCEKNGANVTNMIPSADFGNSVGLKGDNHGSHEGWWIKSTPIVHISGITY